MRLDRNTQNLPHLKRSTNTPRQASVYREARYRQRAQALQAEYARYDAVGQGVALLEQLASTGRAVRREDAAAAFQISLRHVSA